MYKNLISKRGKIAPYQLFFVLFVSRIVVSLTYVQTVSVGILSTDFLISIALSFLFTMLLSIACVLCSVRGLKPPLIVLYAVYFVWLSSLNVGRFSYFASSRINANSSMIYFIIAIVVAGCYCAILGIESVSRFGSFCGVLLIITVFSVFLFNIHNLDGLNYFPIYTNSKNDILKNALVMTSNSIEPALLLVLSNRINGAKAKPFYYAILSSYFTVFMLILFVIGVLGSASSLQSYPIFTLFQMASVGSFSRLDMLHTAFWVLALLLKISVLIYSSSLVIKKYKHSTKCIIISFLVIVISIISNSFVTFESTEINKYISLISFVLFVLVLPIVTLIRGRKNEIS